MKTAYRFFAAVAILAASISITSCNEKIITADELNGTALAFIQEYFPQTAISYIKKDPEMTKTTYEVVLEDGTKIEFNSKGEWDNVDCKKSPVPAALVPQAIAEYLKASFPGQSVVKIDKELYGYEVELENGLELRFGKNGNLVNVDD